MPPETLLPWIDWEAAASAGRRLVRPGVTDGALLDAAALDLKDAALRAPALIAEAAGLPETGGERTLAIDRSTWVTANMRIAARVVEQVSGEETSRPASLGARIRGRALGAQMGGAFAMLAPRVLGQFDPFTDEHPLLLVVPNVIRVEQELQLDPADFRLWVVLHEQTHRVQFANAPWLREHLISLVGSALTQESDSGLTLEVLLDRVSRGLRDRQPSSVGPAGILMAPAVQQQLDAVVAVMSLLEGHADVMMDLAAPGVIPTLPTIRERFEHRRDRKGWQALLGRLLGLDAKIAQYRDGAVFCRTVIESAGVRALNRCFESAQWLPTLGEIRDPRVWLERVG